MAVLTDFIPQKFERYLVHPNESIEKLTVNRSFQRIYEDIETKQNASQMSLIDATEHIYGKAKFSSLSGYEFSPDNLTESTSADYYNSMLTVDNLRNFSESISDRVSNSVFWTPEVPGNEKYWIKSEYCNVDFTYIPNGVSIITGNLELGFNNIKATFGNNNEVLSGDMMSPQMVDGYSTYINITDETKFNIDAYKQYSEFDDKENVSNLLRMDGTKVEIPFIEPCEATLKHNICNWTTYSSFKQSYVELHYTSKVDVKSLYETQFGKDTFIKFNNKKADSKVDEDTRKFLHPHIIFEQKPIVMMQVGFYGGESISNTLNSALFGRDNRTATLEEGEEVVSVFNSFDTVSEQPLSTNDENVELSPVTGSVMVKKIENEYDDNGIITNNIIHFDVIMKFSVGSAADPRMIHGLTTINSKAKLQFAIIGV